MGRNNKWKNERNRNSPKISSYYMEKEIVDEMFRLLKKTRLEIGGLVIGYIENGTVYGQAIIFPPNIEQTPTFCSFKTKDMIYVAQQLYQINEEVQPEHNLRIVSWIHSHPGLTTFLSGTDIKTFKEFKAFDKSFIAVVIDPHKGDIEWFPEPNNNNKSRVIPKPLLHTSSKDMFAISLLTSRLSKRWLETGEAFIIVMKPPVVSLATDSFVRKYYVDPGIKLPTLSEKPAVAVTKPVKTPESKPVVQQDLVPKLDYIASLLEKLSVTPPSTTEPSALPQYTVPSSYSEAYNHLIQGMRQTLQGINKGFETFALSTKAFIDVFDGVRQSQQDEIASVNSTLRSTRDELNSKLQSIYESTTTHLEKTRNLLNSGLTEIHGSIKQQLHSSHTELTSKLSDIHQSTVEELKTLSGEQKAFLTKNIDSLVQNIKDQLHAFSAEVSNIMDVKVAKLVEAVNNNNELFNSLTQELHSTTAKFKEMMTDEALTKINNIYNELDRLTSWGSNFNNQMEQLTSTFREMSDALSRWKTDMESLWKVAEESEVIFEKHYAPDTSKVQTYTSSPIVKYLLLTKTCIVVEYTDSKNRDVSTRIVWDTIKELYYRRLPIEEFHAYAFDFKGKTKLQCTIVFETEEEVNLVLSKLKANTAKLIRTE